MRNGIRVAIMILAAFTLSGNAAAQNDSSAHWVVTWATAQGLIARQAPIPGANGGGTPPSNAPGATRGGAPSSAAPAAPSGPPANVPSTASGSGTNAPAAPSGAPPQAGRGLGPVRLPIPASLSDQTIRMIVRASIGGSEVRIEVSNMLNAAPLEIGAAHIGVHAGQGVVASGTDRALTFGGKTSFVVPPGVLAVSDPVSLNVAPLSDLAVSLYFPHDTGAPATHLLGLRTGYISKGDDTALASMPDPDKTMSYLWLSSVDVMAPKDSFAIVAYGDSITDGFRTTPDAEKAWPALLATRLSQNKATQHVAVLNEGISGNQVLRDGAGLSALARFDRDVLSRPGVKWVVLLEGINDINGRGRTDAPGSLTSDELIGAYHQLIERCHEHGIRIIGATVMPEMGVPVTSEHTEQIRQAVNAWIRTAGNFDGVVDFDKVVQDPQSPAKIRADFDPGDHLHPNDLGNQAMADAFDLKLFAK